MESVERLRKRVAALTMPIILEVRTSDLTQASAQATLDLLHLLVTEGPVNVNTHIEPTDGVVITITTQGRPGPISFWGTPSGFELEGLVSAMEAAAHVGRPLPPNLRGVLEEINRPLEADLYVAPT